MWASKSPIKQCNDWADIGQFYKVQNSIAEVKELTRRSCSHRCPYGWFVYQHSCSVTKCQYTFICGSVSVRKTENHHPNPNLATRTNLGAANKKVPQELLAKEKMRKKTQNSSKRVNYAGPPDRALMTANICLLLSFRQTVLERSILVV
jgi:hypothetical protein